MKLSEGAAANSLSGDAQRLSEPTLDKTLCLLQTCQGINPLSYEGGRVAVQRAAIPKVKKSS